MSDKDVFAYLGTVSITFNFTKLHIVMDHEEKVSSILFVKPQIYMLVHFHNSGDILHKTSMVE